MKLKVGDKVRMKDDHSITGVVESVPGMKEYDDYCFGNADKGFVLKDGRWEYQKYWELIPESLKDVSIKLRVTPEQSRKVQETCFKHGVYWCNGDKEVLKTDKTFLYINEGILEYGGTEYFFNEQENTEVTYQEFMDRWGEEEETFTYTYPVFSLEDQSSFKRIKEISINLDGFSGGINTLQTNKWEDVMSFKKVTNFIKGMKQPLKTLYQLEWVGIKDDEYMPTREGIAEMDHYNFMKEAGLVKEKTFAEYATAELKRRKKAEKEEE
jgi:hypothetical protein